MRRKILSLLFTIALSGTAAALPVSGSSRVNATVEPVPVVNHESIRPPVASRTFFVHRGIHAPDIMPESAAADQAPALDVSESSLLSMTYNVSALLFTPVIEKGCLATAVYFEARSEPERGQLAVAAVILNRVKSPHYPSSVCSVVYQGASRLNSCQFSFACDGKPDLAKNARAWKKALTVATTALNDGDDSEIEDAKLRKISKATHYHADYVRPKWSRSLHRLTKIGRHIFYSQG